MRNKKKAAKCCNTKTADKINLQAQYTPAWFARQGRKVAIKWFLQGNFPFETIIDLFRLHPQWNSCKSSKQKKNGE